MGRSTPDMVMVVVLGAWHGYCPISFVIVLVLRRGHCSDQKPPHYNSQHEWITTTACSNLWYNCLQSTQDEERDKKKYL